MARKSEQTTEAEWYHPAYLQDGEIKRDSADDPNPFRVKVEPVTGAEMAKLEAKHLNVTNRANALSQANNFVETLFGLRVHEVENYDCSFDGVRYTPKSGKELVKALRAGPASEWSVTGEDIVSAIRDGSKLRSELPPSSASPSATG